MLSTARSGPKVGEARRQHRALVAEAVARVRAPAPARVAEAQAPKSLLVLPSTIDHRDDHRHQIARAMLQFSDQNLLLLGAAR